MERKSSDIRISFNGNAFKYRVAGIVEQNGKILIVKMNDDEYFCLPGGHVEILESTKKAVQRELDEELYFKSKVTDLFCVSENFYLNRGKKFHEIAFYYKAVVDEKNIDMSDKFVDELDNGNIVKHHFKWIDKNQFENLCVKPKEIVESFFENNNGIKHFVTNDLI